MRMIRRVIRHTFPLPSGRVITTESVRCPGPCRGLAGFERIGDGRVRITSHGGGRLGLSSCPASGRIVVVSESNGGGR